MLCYTSELSNHKLFFFLSFFVYKKGWVRATDKMEKNKSLNLVNFHSQAYFSKTFCECNSDKILDTIFDINANKLTLTLINITLVPNT